MPFRKCISRVLKYLSCSHQKPKVLITIRYLVLLQLWRWHSLATALINLPGRVHPLAPEIIFLSTSSEFIFPPKPPPVQRMHFKGVQNNQPKDNPFKRFHFKCNLPFIKYLRGVIRQGKLKLRIRSLYLYCQFSLFPFLSNDGGNSMSIFLQFSKKNDSTKCCFCSAFLPGLLLTFRKGCDQHVRSNSVLNQDSVNYSI